MDHIHIGYTKPDPETSCMLMKYMDLACGIPSVLYDDDFYRRTNETAHKLDESRCTGGVRANKKSHLLEDVYTYNDFVHSGFNKGCEPKKNITSDMSKPYLISEYNGHMFPTKSFDDEDKEKLEAATKELSDKIMPIGAKMYQQASSEAPKSEDNSSSDGDAVEGEVVDK